METTQPQLMDWEPWRNHVRAKLTQEQNAWADDDSLHECWVAGWSAEDVLLQVEEAWKEYMEER